MNRPIWGIAAAAGLLFVPLSNSAQEPVHPAPARSAGPDVQIGLWQHWAGKRLCVAVPRSPRGDLFTA